MCSAVDSSGDERRRRHDYGTLATRLEESLREARGALEEHGALLPEGRIDALDRILEELAARRVRIAIYGEVKAGKSTLINAIAGRELSPAAFDPLTPIPVRITYGTETRWSAGGEPVDGVEGLRRLMREGVEDLEEILVETKLDLLQLGGQLDLLDTPGVGSESRHDQVSAAALRSLDAVVLVVRYPALFTKLTRNLVSSLESDIGKLFVVWNLDAACAELSDEERAEQAETLKRNVSGAHELYLVDARAALRAAEAGDAAGIERSGLSAFADALARFASSEKRQVAALREAAKRSEQWLTEAERTLQMRREELQTRVREARRRLHEVAQASEAREREAREQFARVQAEIDRASHDRAAEVRRRAAELRRALRSARWSWIQQGGVEELRGAVARAVSAFADRADDANHEAARRLERALSDFGASFSASPRARTEPELPELGSAERLAEAETGRLRALRRLIWRHWYLPGLQELQDIPIETDLEGQAEWFTSVAASAEATARRALQERVEKATREAASRSAELRDEYTLEASEAELASIRNHLPVVVARAERVVEIHRDSRTLV